MTKSFIRLALALFVTCALFLIGCAGSGGGPSTSLVVVSTSPVNGATLVPVSSDIVATFSEAINPATLQTSMFRVTSAGNRLAGTLTSVGNTASFHLTSAMPINSPINVRILAGVQSVSGIVMSSDYSWSFSTSAVVDAVNPTVSSTDPANAETGVPLNKKVSALFSEPMAPASINGSTFTLLGPTGSVGGTVSYVNGLAVFAPTVNLTANSLYTATISVAAMDLSGNGLATNKVWSFTTGVNSDTTAPTVVSTDPASSDTGVPINKKVTATFSETMDPATISTTSFKLSRFGSPAVTATVIYGNQVATLTPASPLAANTIYTATITTGVKDAAGNSMAAAKIWSFTTAATGDTTAPFVVSTNPADAATGVFLNASVNATFSEAMRANTLNTASFTVAGVAGSVIYDTTSHIATFKPSADLAANTTYTARIETSAQDSAGNGMVVPKIWSFTTGTQKSQGPINLGAAGTYAVLAGSTVTNGGPTVINGDLGVSPGSAVTGFPPGFVNGAIHAGDAAAAQAKSDLLAGQIDAAGRLGGLVLPGDLSGLTFTPGLYKNSSSVMLSAGNVTLDALGDSNAVFVFQMGSTLTTNTGTQVVLAGGAKASNIYWSVGTSATLGVNSIFKGIVLADASITVNTGAVHSGVLLTRTGAVTLLSNTVTRSRDKTP